MRVCEGVLRRAHLIERIVVEEEVVAFLEGADRGGDGAGEVVVLQVNVAQLREVEEELVGQGSEGGLGEGFLHVRKVERLAAA